MVDRGLKWQNVIVASLRLAQFYLPGALSGNDGGTVFTTEEFIAVVESIHETPLFWSHYGTLARS